MPAGRNSYAEREDELVETPLAEVRAEITVEAENSLLGLFARTSLAGGRPAKQSAYLLLLRAQPARMKLGEAFTRRNIAPLVFEKKEDARAFLASLNAQNGGAA